MSLRPPFYFINESSNSTSVLDKYIFNNNKGLALFIITWIVFIFAAWELVLRKLVTNAFSQLKSKINLENQYLKKVSKFLDKFGSW